MYYYEIVKRPTKGQEISVRSEVEKWHRWGVISDEQYRKIIEVLSGKSNRRKRFESVCDILVEDGNGRCFSCGSGITLTLVVPDDLY